jgi:hypothetical protein
MDMLSQEMEKSSPKLHKRYGRGREQGSGDLRFFFIPWSKTFIGLGPCHVLMAGRTACSIPFFSAPDSLYCFTHNLTASLMWPLREKAKHPNPLLENRRNPWPAICEESHQMASRLKSCMRLPTRIFTKVVGDYQQQNILIASWRNEQEKFKDINSPNTFALLLTFLAFISQLINQSINHRSTRTIKPTAPRMHAKPDFLLPALPLLHI